VEGIKVRPNGWSFNWESMATRERKILDSVCGKGYKKIGDLVWAMLLVRNADNMARRVALATVKYERWGQGDPQAVHVVVV
jgi:hypothetical protein